MLIGHDWGGALAFDWAARHPGGVHGVAFTETIVKPMTWQEFPEGGREVFRAIKTAGLGEAMILDDNLFIEEVLPGSIDHGLSETDLDAYRKPYPTRESRRPILQWARAMPLGGEPAEVVARIERYGGWLTHSADVPKLLLTFDPGAAMLSPELIDWCVTNMADLEVESAEQGAITRLRINQKQSLPPFPPGWTGTACGQPTWTDLQSARTGLSLATMLPKHGAAVVAWLLVVHRWATSRQHTKFIHYGIDSILVSRTARARQRAALRSGRGTL